VAINAKQIKAELAKRAQQASAPKFSLSDYCFKEQLAFVLDTARFKTAVCSRRAGKTEACAADLFYTAMNFPGDVAYITLNRVSAKRIIWRSLLKFNTLYNANAHIDNQELSLTLPNGNVIYVSGAKDESEIEKFRGLAIRKVYIDEAQSFRSYIEMLVNEVLTPALTDYNGSLIMIGTPGPVPAGYFYVQSHNKEWANHKWTMHNNPHIQRKSGKSPEKAIEDICKIRGVSINDPSIRREFFGEWIKDENSLVYKFNPAINTYDQMPPGKWQYIFGIDIGWNDSDAIAVMAYDFKQDICFLVEEIITEKQDITSLANQIKDLQQHYKPIKMVMDAGALGKKIQEEIRFRHSLPVEAASKERKFEFIKLLNGDLRSGKVKVRADSRFAQDCERVVWDWDDPAKPKISDRYHTDIGDAVLYAWREAKHYFEKETVEVFNKNSDQYMDKLEAEEAERFEAQSKGDDGLGVDVQDLEDIYTSGLEDELDD
jgi:hypothetical protein